LAILYEDTAYARATAEGAAKRAAALGLDVRVNDVVAAGGEAAAVARCARGGGDVLLSTGYSDHAVALQVAVRGGGPRPRAYVGAGAGYNTDRFAAAAGADAANVLVTGNAPASAFDEERLSPAASDRLRRYRAHAAAAGLPERDADLELAFQGTLLV